MRSYVAELLGSFALVFCGTGAIVVNEQTNGSITHVGIALTFGLIVTAMIYAFGPVSGAHINPAVSIAFSFTSLFERKKLWGYLCAQFLGSIAASALLKGLFPNNMYLGATMPSGSWGQSFVLEIVLTYLLMLVILFTSQHKDSQQFTGISVGATVALEAMFAGPITGASMNPARSLAPAIMSGYLSDVWIYLLAPVVGAVLASLTWKVMQAGTD